MAVSESGPAVVEPQAPPTPPSDQMDLDGDAQESALSNGHTLKDLSLDPPSSVAVSAQLSVSLGSSVPNGVKSSHAQGLISDAPSPVAALTQSSISQATEENNSMAPQSTMEALEVIEQQHPDGDTEHINGVGTGEPVSVASMTLSSSALETEANGKVLSPEAGDQVGPSEGEHSPSHVIDMEAHPDDSLVPEKIAVITAIPLPHHPPVPVPDGAALENPIAPAPSPVPLQEPSPTSKLTPPMNDQHMSDVQPVPAKLARARDEDDEDGPATKRSKTDEDIPAAPEFKVPVLPNIVTNVTDAPNAARPEHGQPITKAQQKFILRVVQNIKRLNDAAPFTKPVDVVTLNIPSYPTIVTKPMDLRTIEEKVKEEQYSSVDVYIDDFNLIIENSILFNGLDHVVTKNAQNIKASFDKQMVNLPRADVADPTPADKKKKMSISSTPKAPPSRRESRSSLPGSARSPASATSPTTTFALGPQGVPLIRRDSNVSDGRPKREIHPPAPRDLPYASQKPKKKKYQLELKFCQYVLNELQKPKHNAVAFPFLAPVDPVALNIPHYHKIIKQPMDLSTIASKLNHGQYENAKEFEADVRLMFQNCYKFNPRSDPVFEMGEKYEGVFNSKWAERSRWIEANTPASGRQSPGSSPEPEEEEDEEEVDEEEEEQSQLSKLQQQIAAMSRQVELITQKKKTPPTTVKKTKGAKVPKEKAKKGTSAAPAAKPEKKASKPAKKEKTPYVTYEQKQDISNRINSLSESRMSTALKIIRDNMPSLKGVQEDELELDIDELSDEVLHKLLVFVRKHAPRPEDSSSRRAAPPAPSTAQPRKKNKPMSKTEQEARIEQVKGNLSAFQNPGGDENPHAHNTAAPANDTSGDEDDTEESEEE